MDGPDLLDRLTHWAEDNPDVRVVILLGSHAVDQSDAHSDYDVVLYLADPDRYAQDDAWQEDIGNVWHCFKGSKGGKRSEDRGYWRAVIFAPGIRFDIGLKSTDDLDELVTGDPSPGINDYSLGYRVLVDKDDLTSEMAPPFSVPLVHARPTKLDFTAVVEEFWHEAHNVAKYLARGDLWCVKHREFNTKRALLPMLEWHAHATHGWSYDTSVGGKRIGDWADADTWEELTRSFAGPDPEDGWRALLTTVGLFRRLSRETAQMLDFQFPDALFTNMEGLVRSMKDHR